MIYLISWFFLPWLFKIFWPSVSCGVIEKVVEVKKLSKECQNSSGSIIKCLELPKCCLYLLFILNIHFIFGWKFRQISPSSSRIWWNVTDRRFVCRCWFIWLWVKKSWGVITNVRILTNFEQMNGLVENFFLGRKRHIAIHQKCLEIKN